MSKIEDGLKKLRDEYENKDKPSYRIIYCLEPDKHKGHHVDFKATFSRDGSLICPICLNNIIEQEV